MAKLRAMLQLSLVSPLLSVAQAGNGTIRGSGHSDRLVIKLLNR